MVGLRLNVSCATIGWNTCINVIPLFKDLTASNYDMGIKQRMMPTTSIFLYYLSDFFSMNDFS